MNEMKRKIRTSKEKMNLAKITGNDILRLREQEKETRYQNALKALNDAIENGTDNSISYMKSSETNEWKDAKPHDLSKEQRKELLDYAKANNVKIYGINDFDGDPELLKAQIDEIQRLREEFPALNRMRKLTLHFSDFDAIESDSFAKTVGNNITFNKVVLRDREITVNNLGNFFSSKDPEHIVSHELGHVLTRMMNEENSQLWVAKEVFRQTYGYAPSDDEIAMKLPKLISEAATLMKIDQPINRQINGKILSYRKDIFPEIIPEITAYHNQY